ncbi:glycosyltransferase family 4 protein [Parasedimentitalea psychrophila]|uniref:Glycosyltransferase family 4 protein n=1 Tax=Parasedimentitalea psychrophila TaxID=2997337 RepID=A0A9Y2L435_9RHOB|nr:glycosyltransferase family 4 protein [Parasedimentitalea psychrophila]WIY27743.1 glycosyltransferase family 4 protein [Parasedimentitalea psychrophila]
MRDTVNAVNTGEVSPKQGTSYRALFVTAGDFSHINAQMLQALQSEFPNVEFESFGVSERMQSEYPALFGCVLGTLREYGFSSLGSRALLRYRLFRSKAFFETVRRMLKRRFGDRGFDFTVQTQSLFSAALTGCPNFVYTDHVARARLADEDQDGTGQPSEVWLNCESEIYAEAEHVFTFGPKIRDFLLNDYGMAPGKVSAIGAGASVTPEREVDSSQERYGRRNILFVGVEWERKGGPELIKAFCQLRKTLPDATLTIIGCAPDVEVDGCQVIGRLPIAEMAEYFHRASCFCMPSRVEPFGVVFLEAMQFGLPVISTTVGDIGAIVQDGVTGRLVAPRNSAELAQALYQVLADPGTCREMGRAAQHRGRQFTWEAVVRRIAAHAPGAAERPAAEELRW